MEGEGEGGRCRERRHSQRAEKKNKTKRTNGKIVQEKTGEKKKINKQKKRKKQTDKQEKNRKPVNQGKSYMRDCPDVDL